MLPAGSSHGAAEIAGAICVFFSNAWSQLATQEGTFSQQATQLSVPPLQLAVGNNVALVRPAVPQQKNPDGSYNGTECGAFTLTFLEHFMAANPEDISEGSSGVRLRHGF